MPTDDQLDLKIFLNDRIKERGFTVKRLSEVSGIALKHLENLLRGRYEDLPPAPYLRGYIEKLGDILEFDPTPVWNHMKKLRVIKGSGSEDELPKNRFAPRPLKKHVWVIVVGILLALYFILRFSKIFGTPELAVVNPPADATMTVHEDVLVVRGTLTNADQLFVNDVSVQIGASGEWQKEVLLSGSGLNPIKVTAKKFLGGEKTVDRQVFYEPIPGSIPSTNSGQASSPQANATSSSPAVPAPTGTNTTGTRR